MAFWLLKSEPSTYSFADLTRDRRTHWNGVRNFQARNFIKTIEKGDQALIYHSGDDRAVVGLAKVVSLPYADPDPKKPGDWLQFDIEVDAPLRRPVALGELKQEKRLKDLLLIRQGRLSVSPLTAAQFQCILELAGGGQSKPRTGKAR